MHLFKASFGLGLTLFSSMAYAFCDDLLATQVLCLSEDADEIKLCATQHPETGAAALELHVAPPISKGPITKLTADIPFAMTPGTGGFPWDIHEFTFVHDGGRAVVALKTPMTGVDPATTEIWLGLFDRGTAPVRSIQCMVPALRAEIGNLLKLRGISLNKGRTGPGFDSAPFYQPEKPIGGAAPYGGYDCREVEAVLSHDGADNGQIALFSAPENDAALLGYAFPLDIGPAFECAFENGFSGVIWIDPDKEDGAGGDMRRLGYESRLAACALRPEDWPANLAYLGPCSSAWIKDSNIAGVEG